MPVSTFSPGPRFVALRAATSRHHLAEILGFTPKGLTAVLYHLPDQAKYLSFEIAKKNGGTRGILAPTPALKLLQRRLSDLLYECLGDLDRSKPHLSKSSYGYAKETGIVQNAKRHRAKRYVLNVDIENFFGAINFGRVRGYFISNAGFSLDPAIATVIAQIACFENSLPQGSPCSPIISNLIGRALDFRLASLAKTHSSTYTRYVDDITISTNSKEFPSAIASMDADGVWTAGDALVNQIVKSGFSLNIAKTRMHVRSARQSVTGLTVNSKVNVRRDYAMRARACVRSVSVTGRYEIWPSREKVEAGEPFEKEQSLNRLESILHHIYAVRDASDYRDLKKKKSDPTSFRKTYFDFLFLKSFIALQKPSIICEGKTDNIYIRSAMKSLNSSFPDLGDWNGSAFFPGVTFFRYSAKSLSVMGLGGGVGDISKLIREYRKVYQRLAVKKPKFPVIIIVDNDAGGKDVFKAIKDMKGPTISIADATLWYKAFDNVYVVKTPQLSSSQESCIEQLFDAATLGEKVGGKSLDYSKDNDTTATYGKHIFAERVVRPKWEAINFAGFIPVLTAIREVIADFK